MSKLIRPRMEPDCSTVEISEREALISLAISMKRIADALWGIEGTSGLLQLLNPLDVRNNY